MQINNNSNRLGEEPILQLLLKLSIPSIIGMASQALYNVVDSIYVGHLSKEALAALSIAFPIQMVLIGVAVGTGIGTNSLISRLLGSGKGDRANAVASHSALISIFFGLLFSIIGYFYSEAIISFFTDDNLLIDLAGSYIRIILIGSVSMFFPMIANNILRGEGNTFLPMITLIIGSITNIILDPFLIFGIGFFPKLGIEGAAYATVVARSISGIYIFFILKSEKNQIKISYKNFKLNLQIIREIYQVGFPALLMQILASFMLAGINRIVVSLNVTALAVVGIFFRLQSFFFMPVFGLTQGYIPIVGYNYGYNNPERIKQTIKIGMIISLFFTTAGFIAFQFLPKQLIMMFNKDPELISIGVTALKRISLILPFIGPAIIASTTFQALGKGMPSLIFAFLRQIIILLPLMYILGYNFGLDILWFAFPISDFITVSIVITWLIFYLKTKIRC